MSDRSTPTAQPPQTFDGEPNLLQHRLIDALMAAPIKEAPAVVVFGDDDVVGFTPAPRKAD